MVFRTKLSGIASGLGKAFGRLGGIIPRISKTTIILSLKDSIRELVRKKGAKLAATAALAKLSEEVYKYFTFEEFIRLFLGDEVLNKLKESPNYEDIKKLGDKFIGALKEFNHRLITISAAVGVIDEHLGRIVMEYGLSLIWSIGIGWLSWVTLSPLLTTIVADKMSEAGYYAFRPRDLTPSQVIRLLRLHLKEILDKYKREIELGRTPEEAFLEAYKDFIERLRRYGYPDEVIKEFIEINFRLLTLSQLQNAWKYNIIDENKFKEYLYKLGYKDEEIKILVDLTKVTKIEKERDLTKSEILRAYRYNKIGREEAINYLIRLGYDKKEAELLLRIEDYNRVRRIEGLSRALVRRMYLRGVIDDYEAMNLLKELGYTDEAINRILELWKVEKERRKPKIPLSVIRLAFMYNIIDANKVKQYLQSLNYPDNIIDLYIKVWSRQRERIHRKLSPTTITNLLRYNVISEEEAIEHLRKIGYTREDAELLVKYALSRPYPRRIRLTRRDIITGVKKGVIDRETAKFLLQLLGYSEEEAEYLLTIYT